MGFHSDPDDSKPDKELSTILKTLCAEPNNRIVIITGRGRHQIEKWMDPFDLEMITEHGVWHKEKEKDWRRFVEVDNTWKKEFRGILEMYVDRTPGSFIEEKDYSLVWHYRKVETGLGDLRSRELTSHLKYVSSERDIQVQEGSMVIEIKNSQVNKGVAAASWINEKDYDFYLACGDYWTDEDTFRYMPEQAHTIKVGSNSSAAKYRVEDYKDIRSFLRRLSN